MKPLGIKSYVSIPHLPASKLGPGDHSVNEQQARIATVRARDAKDLVIVQEKLDGSNVSIANINGQLLSLGRAGYLASTSSYKQHQIFAQWVRANEVQLRQFLQPGDRLCGEWLLQAHGTKYKLVGSPFVAFDLFLTGNVQVTYAEFEERMSKVQSWQFRIARAVHIGGPCSVDSALALIGKRPNSDKTYGRFDALEPVEGAIWKVERAGKVDFMCKWVRPDYEAGKYLLKTEPVWNEGADKFMTQLKTRNDLLAEEQV